MVKKYSVIVVSIFSFIVLVSCGGNTVTPVSIMLPPDAFHAAETMTSMANTAVVLRETIIAALATPTPTYTPTSTSTPTNVPSEAEVFSQIQSAFEKMDALDAKVSLVKVQFIAGETTKIPEVLYIV